MNETVIRMTEVLGDDTDVFEKPLSSLVAPLGASTNKHRYVLVVVLALVF
jgi:hypothetical protein